MQPDHASAKNDTTIPRQIGRYQVLKLLDRGGMGAVYHAYDPDLNREVVLKFIDIPALTTDDNRKQRFRREVQAASRLNHPHIVTIFDVNLEHVPPYVVMELLTGGTLQTRLKQRPLPWRTALKLLRPLVEALAYAHRAGVIHRDVKPANIMFAGDEANSLKLVDFGLARRQDEEQLTQTGVVIGTPAYMSPEQARAETIDARTDIFALGIIIFEAITGRNPLDKGSSILTLVEAGSDTQIDSSPLVGRAPPPVIHLIRQAIAREPDRRYPSCQALLVDLDRCLEETVESKRPSSQSTLSISPSANGPEIRLAGDIVLTDELESVLRTMFSDFKQVAVEVEFGRGFSGSRAFRVRLVEAGGRAHLPAAVKIAPAGLIRAEWQAYQQWVEPTLPNIARLYEPPVLSAEGRWGGLRYALVGGGTFKVHSLHHYYHTATVEDLVWVLEERLFRIMGSNWWLDNRTDRAFQMQSDYDILLPVNLLLRYLDAPEGNNVQLLQAGETRSTFSAEAGDQIQIKGFVITKVHSERRELTLNLPAAAQERRLASYRIRLKEVADITRFQVDDVIDSIYGQVLATRQDALIDLAGRALGQAVDLSQASVPLSSELELPNPLLTYRKFLRDFMTVNISTIHGDLNLENVLVDSDTRDVSLIDFATVRQGHNLQDLLRLETEVVIMLLPPILAETGLSIEIIQPFYRALHEITSQLGQTVSPPLPHPALEKPFEMVRAIRRMARKSLFNMDDWTEYYRGLLIYLLGAMKFDRLDDLPTAPLPRQVAFWTAAISQDLLNGPSPQRPPAKADSSPSGSSAVEPSFEIEPPFGTMRPDSRFYIERSADHFCWQHFSGLSATTLFVQAPMQMGKSSLMRQMLYRIKQTHHRQTAFIDFQKFTEKYLADEEAFFIQLCLMISDAFDIPEAIDQYWTGRRTNIVKCSLYLSRHIIPKLSGPFILAMDEVERMLPCPFRANFFGMLRTWHNDRVYDENFARMSLFISSSTDPYLLIDNPNQSPFNVATLVALHDFSREEVQELNRRHRTPLTEKQVDRLMDLVKGQPFLTRLALYHLTLGEIDFETLLAQATADTGPFGEHLRHYTRRILQKPALRQALAQISKDGAYEEDQLFYRLQGAGLVKRVGKQVLFRNNLYKRYFKERLDG